MTFVADVFIKKEKLNNLLCDNSICKEWQKHDCAAGSVTNERTNEERT